MKLDPIVISLLDTDLYKFNMDQVIFHKHTDLCGKYYFKCRNKDIRFTKEMLDEINSQIDHLCTLRFRKDELDYLRSIRFIKNDYVEFLRLWRPIREYVTTELSDDGELSIIVDGPLFSAMQFEIHLLEIVNEVYFRMSYDYDMLLRSAEEKLNKKIEALNDGTYTFKFAEFGCRRRLSREWEDVVVRRLSTETDKCIGTSNVYLAMKYNLTPIGTYAHEFVQMYQGIDRYPLAYTNHYAMRDWYDEYDGDFDIAILDVMMPGIDGFQVCKELRNRNGGIGIIMLSAKTQEMDKVTGLMLGADDYVAKPFSPSELLARVDSLYRRVALAQSRSENNFKEELKSGDFTLNLRNRALLKNGKMIELTQVEFQIMEYFFSNPGVALDRIDILNHVWGDAYVGEDKIVDVNIRRLRMKVEDEPSNPKHIITVWGLGYKWDSGE